METRRKFLKKMAAAGASALVVPQLLASCGKEEDVYKRQPVLVCVFIGYSISKYSL